MVKIVECVNEFLWSIPLTLLIAAVGLYLTLSSGFLQIRLLPRAIRSFFNSLRNETSDSKVTPYRALCTALAATVGTGNLAGVAGAIAIGGPGAIFWMWLSGILGMIIKFAEVVIAIHYREKNSKGEWVGGPMMNISKGMPAKFHTLAYVFSFFGIIAAFGVGNATQVNTIVGGIESIALTTGCQMSTIGKYVLGIILAGIILYAFYDGVQRIGRFTQFLVPFAAVAYIILSVGALIVNVSEIPGAIQRIILGAFSPHAVTGGALGSILQTMRIGISRGIFTNEAGMGTASIAHASADTEDPIEQGLLGIMEVFLDTIVICTLTALVILCTNVPIDYGTDSGIKLTMLAFSSVYDTWIQLPLTLITCLLAVATILGWGFYGARCAQFIFGDSVWKWFVLLQAFAVMLGVTGNTGLVWTLSELTNGLMAIPNLLSLGYLTIKQKSKIYAHRLE